MLGMGGSQLYIPILYWLGLNFKHEAIPLGLLLNMLTSFSAAYTYYRHGLIKVRLAIPFALTMIVFAPIGAVLDFRVSTKIVILVFALFTMAGAVLAVTNWKPQKGWRARKPRLSWELQLVPYLVFWLVLQEGVVLW